MISTILHMKANRLLKHACSLAYSFVQKKKNSRQLKHRLRARYKLLAYYVFFSFVDAKFISCCVAVKIGRPGYRVTKQYDSDTKQRSLLFQVLTYLPDCSGMLSLIFCYFPLLWFCFVFL